MREVTVLVVVVALIAAVTSIWWLSWPFIWQLFGFLALICLAWIVKLFIFRRMKRKELPIKRPDHRE